MQEQVGFLADLKGTFSSPAYYARVLGQPLKSSLKFFFLFFLLYSVIITTYVTVKDYLPQRELLNYLPEELVNLYPEELVVTVKDGEVSINVDEPYRIPVSAINEMLENIDQRVLGQSTGTIENILVIDTKGKIEDYFTYQTFFLLTKNHLSYLNESGNVEAISLAEITNWTIDRTVVRDVINTIAPYLRYLIPLMIIVTFLFLVVVFPAATLFYLLILAAILWVVSKLVSYPLSYKKSYQMGMHLILVGVALLMIINVSGINLDIPYLWTIVLVLLGGVILVKIKSLPESTPVAEASIVDESADSSEVIKEDTPHS
ncbi:DUF1189 domain-containing protein [Patescibacteria group bacterium]|nr:DUF1189 domain-containing protein [Patescibacteria group bacterium]MBU1868044.1 DUF1189 domain-containing protein [Patescibacteria group bacterium]